MAEINEVINDQVIELSTCSFEALIKINNEVEALKDSEGLTKYEANEIDGCIRQVRDAVSRLQRTCKQMELSRIF